MPGRFNERRAHPRFYLRCKAVLRLDDQTHGIYMKDISRSGVGFLHDSQLMPKQRCAILLPNGSWLQLKLVRCRRLAPNCYECGAVHHHGE